MIFVRLFDMLASSIPTTIYAFFCTIILCVVFQLGWLKKANKQEDKPLSIGHFVWVYIFLFYLMMVYRVTGMGTAWIIGRYPELIRMNEIYLMPFGSFTGFDSIVPYLLNILMTIPLGFLLPFIWKEFRSIKKVALAGFLLSLGIELSQLLNRRTTTVDDLITNTLGAVVGYLVFKLLHRIFRKDSAPESKHRSAILRNEAIVYLVCSFMGMFLFFGGLLLSGINFGVSMGDATVLSNYTTVSNYTNGTVLEINEGAIRIEKNVLWEYEEGSMISSNSGEEIIVVLTEETIFEIYRTNATGTMELVISQTTRDDIVVNDSIDIYGSFEGDNLVADTIIMWRFDG